MIELAEREIPVGSALRGTVVWRGDEKTLRALTVIVAWCTRGRGEPDWQVVRQARRAVAGATGGSVALRFDVDLPAEGPISYEGTLFSIVWEVAVLADIAWGLDQFESATFRVVPRRA